MKLVLICGLLGLGSTLLGACTEADREAMFSTDRAPLVGKCDPQPGYPPPIQRPGCEYAQYGNGGHNR
jgi:hypothetical protein